MEGGRGGGGGGVRWEERRGGGPGRAKTEKMSRRCRVWRSNKASGERKTEKQEIKKILQTVLGVLLDAINLLFNAEDHDTELRSTFSPSDRLQPSRRSDVAF